MFTLYPDGKQGGVGGSGSSSFYSGLSFFGRLALYFAGIRIAYVFFGEGAEQRAITSE